MFAAIGSGHGWYDVSTCGRVDDWLFDELVGIPRTARSQRTSNSTLTQQGCNMLWNERRLPRRDVVRLATAVLAGGTVAQRVWAQAPASELPPLNRFTRMVHEFYEQQIARAAAVAEKRKAALQSKADAEAYVDFVRQQIQLSFGQFPERTPLKPRISGIVDRDAYTIEKVVFESRPEFFVTGNLYIPKGKPIPRPAVVGSCGHSSNGKAAEAYQSFSQGLARQGYVVLIFDPIGQGERLQYPDEHLEKSHVGVGVGEHLLAGNQQFLINEFFGTWRAWDGIRALDYLLSRPEVDPNHVGITGNSGGGTMTMWLAGLERRWTMAAPSCAVTQFRRNFQNELPADTEQCPPRILSLGIEHDDFLAAMAPRPVIIMAQERDYFDARGSELSYQRLKKLYTLLGAEDKVRLHIGPDEHGYSRPNREAMYGFFNHWTKAAQGHTEPALTIERDATLQVLPRGQVAEIPSRTIIDFTREKAESLAKQRPQLAGAELESAVRRVLRLPEEPKTAPDYRILRGAGNRRYPLPFATTYAVASEPGIEALVTRLSPRSHISRPPQASGPCVLYVSHHSVDVELRNDAWLKERITTAGDTPVYAMDVRGIGESRSDTCGGTNTFLTPYGSDYFYAAHGIMLDRPMPGQRTWDVLRVLAWLQSLGHTEVHLLASQWGTVPATFAAVLSPAVKQITLRHALTSYHAIATAERYDWPLSSFVPGILDHLDLPDCYRALATKNLQQVDPRGPTA